MTTLSNRPAGASVPTDAAPPAAAGTPLTGAVEVLADSSGRVGLLSYLVPEGMRVVAGDDVTVPFGTQTRNGMVIGPSATPDKATKHILCVLGKRADPRDIQLARNIATFHFSDLPTVLTRLSPRKGRDATPITDATVQLVDPTWPRLSHTSDQCRRLYVRAPLISGPHLAALEAARLAREHGGQVLVLCPTTKSVTETIAQFTSGAQRLDTKARAGAWKGFTLGTVTVGVGTRSAALYSAHKLAGIVVIDEDHPGHQEASQPHTHARDLASARTRALAVPLTLISANPTPAASCAGVDIITAGTRKDWPALRLIDRGDHDPLTRWAPAPLLAAINAENKAGRTPWVIAQRRTAVRRCPRCGAPRPCALCNTSLCRHKDTEPCPRCHSNDPARMVGWDAARISDLLNGPPAPDGTLPPPKVKVVTIADIPKGSNVGLVILFDVDAALSTPELIPEALGASLIVTAAQAAGYGGKVIALTDTPQTAALVDLFGPRDQTAVARRAAVAAKAANLPPFGRLITIRTAQESAPRVTGWPGHVLGPTRIAGEWEVLVRIPANELLQMTAPLARLRRGGKVRVTVT